MSAHLGTRARGYRSLASFQSPRLVGVSPEPSRRAPQSGWSAPCASARAVLVPGARSTGGCWNLAGLGQPGRGRCGRRRRGCCSERTAAPSGLTAALRPPLRGGGGKEWGEPLGFSCFASFPTPRLGRDRFSGFSALMDD
uniref:Uncharacterized protein n=1 Tax=Rangifer tarandus platyrhynchus TaxID=3082113 RepID=A0ACB0DYU4_RANTA|nr:unnamed protein product [Rangifer tarandus platyrhynchus]